MIRNIVFDMGHVMIYFLPKVFIERLGVPEEDRGLLMREVFGGIEWIQLDRGSITEEKAVDIMCRRLPERLHGAVRDLVCGWWKEPLMPVEGMAELVRELKGMRYGIYLLSNASIRLSEYFDRIPAAEYFDGKIVSAEWKVLKPQPDIYRILLDTYHLKAEECFFVDDVPANVEGAYCMGICGAVFDGNVDRLRRELRDAGVPVSEGKGK